MIISVSSMFVQNRTFQRLVYSHFPKIEINYCITFFFLCRQTEPIKKKKMWLHKRTSVCLYCGTVVETSVTSPVVYTTEVLCVISCWFQSDQSYFLWWMYRHTSNIRQIQLNSNSNVKYSTRFTLMTVVPKSLKEEEYCPNCH